jgi:glucose-6-phosphate isomerase
MSFYHVNIAHCVNDANAKRIDTLAKSLGPIVELFKSGQDAGVAPILARPFIASDLDEINSHATQIRENYKHVIVCGSGGSALSGRTLTHIFLGTHKPAITYLENVDPDSLDVAINHCDPKETFVIAISKSGNTAETISQFYVLLAHFKKALGDKTSSQFLVMTMKTDNPMRMSAEKEGMKWIEHPADIGGRWAIFTAVGLLPAAIAGMDIKRIRAGAQSVVSDLHVEHPSVVGAAIQYAHMEEGRTISVMMPYAEKLAAFSLWYRQCWAESLGKSGKGTLPVPAMGTTDQHSQLQLYLAGPADKFFNLIFINRFSTGQKIGAPAIEEFNYLQDKTTGDLMGAQQQATLDTLVKHKRPARVFAINKAGEEEIGALAMHFTLEVLFMAALLKVNPLDQPAVEEGKILTRASLLAL